MKQAAMAVMVLLAAWSAHAENEYAEWRLAGSISYSDYQRDDDTVNDGGVGIKISQQYRFNKWFGLEAAFYDSPEFKDDFTPDTPGGESETSYQGLSFDGIGYLPSPSEKIDFFLKGGYFYFFNVDLSIDGVKVDDTTEDGLTLGAGTAIEVTDKVGLRVEFDWYDVSGADLWTLGIGAEYRF
jgi:opacity protein-like surface antigen